jgi:hypothetical protein
MKLTRGPGRLEIDLTQYELANLLYMLENAAEHFSDHTEDAVDLADSTHYHMWEQRVHALVSKLQETDPSVRVQPPLRKERRGKRD